MTAIDVSAKAVLLAILAGFALRLARIGDPNLRHRVWAGVLMAMLALPMHSQLLPTLRLPFAIDTGWMLAQQNRQLVEVSETPPSGQDNGYPSTAKSRLNEAQEPRPFIEPEAVLTHERTHIERWDCLVVLVAEVNRSIFWFHPLAWWLKHRLATLAEAACDDAVIGTTGDRTTYARHLLEVASVVSRQRGRISPLAVSMARRPNVETRIRSILDFTRPLSTRMSSVTSVVLLMVIVPIVAIAAALQPAGESNSPQTGAIETKQGAGGAQSKEPNENKTAKDLSQDSAATKSANSGKPMQAVAPAANSAIPVKPLVSSSTRPSVVVGTMRDDAGTPLSGITVGVTGTQIVEDERGSLDHQMVLVDKTLSNTDGRFELTIPSDGGKLENIKVVAGAEGHGIQWRDVPSVSRPESFEIELPKLQPIRLRLVDIEGRPAQGVSLKVASLMRSGSYQDNRDSFGSFMSLPELGQLWPPSQTTDAEGRCQILRVGHGVGAFVQVDGNDMFAPQTLSLNTGESEERGERDGTYRSNVKNVSASEEAVMPLAPAQFFEGQITLADSGTPAARVRVEVWASQQEFGSMFSVFGKTDDQGKYRINPQAGIRFGVTAFPAKGEPYLAKTIRDISWGTGLKSKKVDVALPRGVLIRGNVVDAETKTPIAGVNVQYVPKDKNPNNSDDIGCRWTHGIASPHSRSNLSHSWKYKR